MNKIKRKNPLFMRVEGIFILRYWNNYIYNYLTINNRKIPIVEI